MTSDFLIRQRTCVCPYFFPLLFLCFFISIFSWLMQMTRSFLFFFSAYFVPRIRSILFLFYFFVYIFSVFLSSFIPVFSWLLQMALNVLFYVFSFTLSFFLSLLHSCPIYSIYLFYFRHFLLSVSFLFMLFQLKVQRFCNVDLY